MVPDGSPPHVIFQPCSLYGLRRGSKEMSSSLTPWRASPGGIIIYAYTEENRQDNLPIFIEHWLNNCLSSLDPCNHPVVLDGAVIISLLVFKQIMFYQQANFANLGNNMKSQSAWAHHVTAVLSSKGFHVTCTWLLRLLTNTARNSSTLCSRIIAILVLWWSKLYMHVVQSVKKFYILRYKNGLLPPCVLPLPQSHMVQCPRATDNHLQHFSRFFSLFLSVPCSFCYFVWSLSFKHYLLLALHQGR
jgi:hypothetical protein